MSIVVDLRKRIRHTHRTTGRRPTTLVVTADELRRLKTEAEPYFVERLSQPDGLPRFDSVTLEVHDE